MGAEPSLGNAPECTGEKEPDPASSKLDSKHRHSSELFIGPNQALPANQQAHSLPQDTESHQAEKGRRASDAEDEMVTQTQSGAHMLHAQVTATKLVAKLSQGMQRLCLEQPERSSRPRAWDSHNYEMCPS